MASLQGATETIGGFARFRVAAGFIGWLHPADAEHSTIPFGTERHQDRPAAAHPAFLPLRPGIMVARHSSLPLAIARKMRPNSKLLLWLEQAPKAGPMSRFILSQADWICTPDPAALVRDFGLAAGRVFAIGETAATVGAPPAPRAPTRCGDDAFRILYAGPLTPISGAYDFQAVAAAWAESHPERRLDLCWVGEGDLKGVLAAQPLPPNLTQSFEATPSGSSPTVSVRGLVRAGETGWPFDPARPGALRDALEAALSAPPEALDRTRVAAAESAWLPEQTVWAAWTGHAAAAARHDRLPRAASPAGAR